ncbi:MAG: peptidoglycan glycosyltransferase [Fibrobacter sp.]|nr:peptidoglycan glycosyltransferase [Fibrobacter sp.]
MKKDSWLKKIARKLLWLFLLLFLLGFLIWFWVFNILPQKDPSAEMTRANIESILTGETRVYYRDQQNVMGAFFDANHRVYVNYQDMPQNLVNALVAAEDARFLKHRGFDWRGFTRAMIANLKAGRVVQGGSTITQQTAKNIFGRESRSYDEKWKELLYALRLEHFFSKEEILEFYLNQFYVSGTGRGLSIAAWYFFSKDPEDLSLAECAFSAGSVKGPSRYDPFIQRTVKNRELAMERAKNRMTYVLNRMLSEDYINKDEYATATSEPLRFRMGQFRYSMISPMERIAEKLSGPFYQNLFDSLGIDAWQKSQLTITSTLDKEAQSSATQAMQNALSDLQMLLGGFVIPENMYANRVHRVRSGEYLLGKVDSVVQTANSIGEIHLDFGQIKGVVNQAELDTFARRVRSTVKQTLGTNLTKGSVLLVKVLDTAKHQGKVLCRIESEPQTQGALFALEQGKVLASVGGFHNTGYDRANKAVRQFGSSWKPLLYALAFQLGWRYTDEIDNSWDIFEYQNQIYKPRPDHSNKGDKVSIAWAGTRSENIATVWLMMHLLDKLSLEEFMEVAERNGYLQRDNESTETWRVRLRDSLGIVLNDNARTEIEFERAKLAIRQEWLMLGREDKAWDLQNMSYGFSATRELKKARGISKEQRQRLNFNFMRLYSLMQDRFAMEARGEDLPPADLVQISQSMTLLDFMSLAARVEMPMPGKNYLSEDSTLYFWPEFRRSLALAEFKRFCQEIGIHQYLQSVPSMPLGTNAITMSEMVVAYQSLLSGYQTRCSDGYWGEPCWIQEIRDRHGAVIFSNEVQERRVLEDSVAVQMAVILRKVIESGTGRRALNTIALKHPEKGNISFPAVGKTGTTNDYRNVAFVGALPTWDSIAQDYRFSSGVNLGTYVGYDDNRAMRNKNIRVAGSSGALPPWINFAQSYLKQRGDADLHPYWPSEKLEQGKLPLYIPGLAGEMVVDASDGLKPTDSSGNVSTMPWLDFAIIYNQDKIVSSAPPEAEDSWGFDAEEYWDDEPLPEWGEPEAEMQW